MSAPLPQYVQAQQPLKPAEPSPEPEEVKKRARFTDTERHGLRAHHAMLTSSGIPLPQSHLSTWFKTTYGHPISQSQISKILSPRYAHLDAPPKLPDNCRNRAAQHPELDKVLGEWYNKAKADGVKASGDDLREMAKRFWAEGKGGSGEMPKFSNGWLEGFKHRHGVERKKYNKDPNRLPKNAAYKAKLEARPPVTAEEAVKALDVLERWMAQNKESEDSRMRDWVKRKLRETREVEREENRIARQAAMDAYRLQNASNGSSGNQSLGGGSQPLGGVTQEMSQNTTQNPNINTPPTFPMHQQQLQQRQQLPQMPQQQRIDPRLESMSSESPYGQRYQTPQGGIGSMDPWLLQHQHDRNH